MIDIIMPCYYENSVIEPCFESIATQTIVDQLRIIMINDCSPYTDCKYTDLIEKYKSRVDILYLETEKNSGPGIARQLGLDAATADWVWFQDDDDVVYAGDTFEQLLKLTIKEPFCVTGWTYYKDVQGVNDDYIADGYITTHGSLFNLKKLRELDLRFDPALSFKEEDTAFLGMCQACVTSSDVVRYDQLVYTKNWNVLHPSITIVATNPIYNFICLVKCKTSVMQFILDHNIDKKHLESHIYEFVVFIPTFITNCKSIIDRFNCTFTQEDYDAIERCVLYYIKFLKRYNINVLQVNYTPFKEEMDKSIFGKDSFFGESSFYAINNFESNYPMLLKELKDCIK